VRRMLVSIACVMACGDSRAVETEIDSVSGTRLKLELFLFDDGTTQVDPSAFYDTREHTECRPARWIDGEQRCVPAASEVRFTDSECTVAVGFAPTADRRPPTHFLAYDEIDGDLVPAKLYRAGARTTDAAEVYIRRGDDCLGPNLPPTESVTYTASNELPAQSMQIVSDGERGEGRLGLAVQETLDGLRVLGTLTDRERGAECRPGAPRSGDATSTWCEPTTFEPATVYIDELCETPGVVVFGDTSPPALRSVDAEGCAVFSALGPEVSTGFYSRDGGGHCAHSSDSGGIRVFALGEPLELPRMERSVEAVPGRRLQRVMLGADDDPDLRFASERLYDSAIRGECQREEVGDEVRCIPVAMRQATTLYTSGCMVPTRVALLPSRTCGPTAFARGLASDGVTQTFHAIGDPVTMTMYTYGGAGCVPYVPPAGGEIRALGPALPPETFPLAVRYGAR
jgi:hypothetical protein